MKINWKWVLRDVIIIFVLTFLGGGVIGIAGGAEGLRMRIALAASNFLFAIVGFIISGCIVKVNNRFRHLFVVAIGVWVTSLINIPLGFASFRHWVLSIIIILIAMAIGGTLSFVIVRPPKPVKVTKVTHSKKPSSKQKSGK